MRRAWRGAMPVALTLPLALEHRPRTRQRRRRRFALAALIALGLALIAAGLWLPATGSAAPESAITLHGGRPLRSLATLAIGDELSLARPDGATEVYEVTALDVVDSERAQLGVDSDERTVVLVTRWPLDAVDVPGSWRYVVTARLVGRTAGLDTRVDASAEARTKEVQNPSREGAQ